MKIVFMGTPEFAVAPLDALLKQNYNIVAVVTAPDKPAGRGQKVQFSEVKEYALLHNLNVLQPTLLKDNSFVKTLQELKPDIIFVVAFRMIPQIIWEIPTFGTINIHASLLPQYRGAAPIHWAVVNGETETGLTSFYINETIDTGNIILQEKTHILPTETTGNVYERLKNMAADLAIKTVEFCKKNPKISYPQQEQSDLKLAPKISKSSAHIDWNKGGREIYNHIRGFSPYPAAWTTLVKDNKELLCKIVFAEFISEAHSLPVGTICNTKEQLQIAVSDGYILPTIIQIEGKKQMPIQECMRGFSFEGVTIKL